MTVVLAVDYGEKRIGLAVSDSLMIAANPVGYIKHTTLARDLIELDALIKERSVDRVVVGLPINMDGSEGPMAEAARKFGDEVRTLGIEVEMWDERMSSRAADAVLIGADLSRKKRKGKRDQVAATWFLQGYLDAKRR